MIFTDLDGTLLDFQTYDPGPAAEAVTACQRAGVPVIPTTSKTAVEVIRLRESMCLSDPFIVENGAVVYFPEHHEAAVIAGEIAAGEGLQVTSQEGLLKILFGVERSLLQKKLDEIAGDLGLSIRQISRMTESEVTSETGLPPASARAVNQREYSEPFLVVPEEGVLSEEARAELVARLDDKAAGIGLNCLLGGRFFHLLGDHTKATAARFVIRCQGVLDREPLSMALGDAPNDFDLLSMVDFPVLVRRPDGSFASGLELPGLVRTGGIGPAGWHEAVMARLQEIADMAD
ncbi:HAD-IIB family hydrolase [Candidatus Zixiibacteriota bacterium]